MTDFAKPKGLEDATKKRTSGDDGGKSPEDMKLRGSTGEEASSPKPRSSTDDATKSKPDAPVKATPVAPKSSSPGNNLIYQM